MGRPRNAEETKQLSIKMPASERQRLLEVAFHASAQTGDPEDFNLSQWVREQLSELMDAYEGEMSNGRDVVNQNYVDARRQAIEEQLANIEKVLR